jgi:hypothetical protein
MTNTNTPDSAVHYATSEEVARRWRLDATKVRRIFVDEPGVLRIGHPGDRYRRRYFTLRIPEDVVERVLKRLTVSARA